MKRALRFAVLAGALAVAWVLFGSGPKDVTLVYDLAAFPGARALEVDLRRGGERVRDTEFHFDHGAPAQVRHEVKLPEGEYRLAFRVDTPAGPVRLDRPLTVSEAGTVVLSLHP